MITCGQKANAATVIVHAGDFGFSPSYVYVNVGDVIVWQLDINVTGNHSTTSAQIPSSAMAWHSPLDAAHTYFSYTVNAPGDYDYVCVYDSATTMPAHFTALQAVTAINEIPPLINGINNVVTNGTVTIDYWLSAPGIATQSIYDMTGKAVRTNSAQESEGLHLQRFNIAQLPKGIYILELTVSNSKSTRKIILQ